MTHVLKDKKSVDVQKDRIVVHAVVEYSDFDNPYLVTSPARFFENAKLFEGIARLKDGDADNVREAIHIAESKMERQYYKYVLNCFKTERHILDNAEKDIDDMIRKNSNNVESINKHILDIVENMK